MPENSGLKGTRTLVSQKLQSFKRNLTQFANPVWQEATSWLFSIGGMDLGSFKDNIFGKKCSVGFRYLFKMLWSVQPIWLTDVRRADMLNRAVVFGIQEM